MKIDVTLGDAVFTCAKCGAERKYKMKAPGYYKSFDFNDILNKKMVHVCNKDDNKFGIMSVTDISLGYDCNMDSILDNAYLTTVPIKENKNSKVELDEV